MSQDFLVLNCSDGAPVGNAVSRILSELSTAFLNDRGLARRRSANEALNPTT
jgi:hypothetical protein